MSYKIETKINDRVISSITFDGYIEKPETHTIHPAKHCDYEYYYFIIDDRPYKANKTDVMTIGQINIDV